MSLFKRLFCISSPRLKSTSKRILPNLSASSDFLKDPQPSLDSLDYLLPARVLCSPPSLHLSLELSINIVASYLELTLMLILGCILTLGLSDVPR